MAERVHVLQVGAPDPEKRSSMVIEESDDDFDVLGQEVPETPVCYFNGQAYAEETYICSGDELLRCDKGVWIRSGSCDTVNP